MSTHTSDLALLHKRLSDLFEQAINIRVPAVETDLFETGVLDSLAFATLLVHLEQCFGFTISIDDLELDDFRSIAKMAEFVSKRLPSGRSDTRQTALG